MFQKAICVLLCGISLISIGINALPQQPNAGLAGLVNDIFNTNPSTTTPRPRQNGFAVFVTPEPNNVKLKFNSISGQNPCQCVRYHMCDPSENEVSTDESFDGFGLIDLRFGGADNTPICDHPLDKCCAAGQTRDTSLTPIPQQKRQDRAQGCGVRNVGGIDFNLVGATDNEAGYGEFPWTVAMLHASNKSYFCAGSLIHPRVVLTAVHCVRQRDPSTFIIRAGEWDTQTDRERLPHEERRVSRVLTHPQFNVRNVAYNFALVILTEPVTIGDHINTVCLPQARVEPTPGTACLATGWGKDLFGAAGRFSVIMKRIPLPIVEFNACQQRLRQTKLGNKFALDTSFICAGGQRGVDTCEGDGGAPLVCPTGATAENRYVQSGIVSWGIGCNDDIPAAYANVALGRDWIDDQMLAYGFSTATYTAQ